MNLPLLMAVGQADDATFALSVSQVLLLLIVVILMFGVSIFTTGFVAKRLDVFDADYTKAAWATVFKNVGAVACAAAYGYVERFPVLFLLIIAVFVPILVYKLVFAATVVQAIIIWIAVVIVEVVVGAILVGLALALGGWLDEKYGVEEMLSWVPDLSEEGRSLNAVAIV